MIVSREYLLSFSRSRELTPHFSRLVDPLILAVVFPLQPIIVSTIAGGTPATLLDRGRWCLDVNTRYSRLVDPLILAVVFLLQPTIVSTKASGYACDCV